MTPTIIIITECSSLAKEKILSIFQHTSNVHVFPAFTLFKKCEHPEIDEARPWIKAGILALIGFIDTLLLITFNTILDLILFSILTKRYH